MFTDIASECVSSLHLCPALVTMSSKQPKLKLQDGVQLVINRYRDNEWAANSAPKGTINDIIANKQLVYHFIQVVLPSGTNDARHCGLNKNAFIQNAFANGAIPVFAFVSNPTKEGSPYTLTFSNVNTDARVIVGGNKNALTKPSTTAVNHTVVKTAPKIPVKTPTTSVHKK